MLGIAEARIAGGSQGVKHEKTLAELQAMGTLHGLTVGTLAHRTDTAGERLLECLTVAEASSTWGCRKTYRKSFMQSSASTSNAERFSGVDPSTILTTASSYALFHCQVPTEILAESGRFINENDPGSVTLKIYVDGVEADTDTIDPGADTWTDFDLSASVPAGSAYSIGYDPENARVAYEKNEISVLIRETHTVTS